MNMDMCVGCGEGLVNIRAGAIILKDDKLLMVRNRRADYFYSVGGRLKFGETAQEAVVREVEEETGARLSVSHLGFIHENYFYGDDPTNLGKLIYELSFYFYMDVPKDFEPVCKSFTEDGQQERLEWVSLTEKRTLYPTFFKTELKNPTASVKHLITDERGDRKAPNGDRQQSDAKAQLCRIVRYEPRYRDDMLFMVLGAKDALGRMPTVNEDLLDIEENYFRRGDEFFVALDDNDRVIGCVGYSRIDNTNEAFLHRLYVKANRKRRGIGSKLLAAAESAMRAKGILVARVHLGEPKEQWLASYLFYPKHGYIQYEPRYMMKSL